MLAILTAIFVWAIFVYALYKFSRKRISFSRVISPLFFIAMLFTVDLSVNYSLCSNSLFNDGITIHGVLSYLVVGNDNWSMELFRTYYHISFIITCVFGLAYLVSLVLEGKQNKVN